MIKKKETINGPEDVLEAVLFKVSKFPDDFSVSFTNKRVIRCVVSSVKTNTTQKTPTAWSWLRLPPPCCSTFRQRKES